MPGPHMARTIRRLGHPGAVVIALTALLQIPGQAVAQARPPVAPAAPPPAPAEAPAAASEPERTTAQYGDWAVTCVAAQGNAGGRVCEMVQTVQDTARQISATLALGRLAPDAPYKIVMRVPVNLQVAQPARVMLDTEAAATLPFRTCVPGSCFAELELRDDALLRRLRARPAEQPGRLEWIQANGAAVALPFSLRGFGAALDALGRR